MPDTVKKISDSLEITALTDIIPLNHLQRLQDIFTAATNVASIIIDLHGNRITKPSNFSRICTLIHSTELGKLQCDASDDERKKISINNDQPTYLKCHPCGFADASIPVFINEQRIADWLIGQVNLNDADRNEIIDYATIIGVDISEMLLAFDKIPKMSSLRFEEAVKLLFRLSSDIMEMSYQEFQSGESDKEAFYNAIENRFDRELTEFKNSFVK
ncbi:MAG: PocR ligand-binding domain-containing protein [bacterium]